MALLQQIIRIAAFCMHQTLHKKLRFAQYFAEKHFQIAYNGSHIRYLRNMVKLPNFTIILIILFQKISVKKINRFLIAFISLYV